MDEKPSTPWVSRSWVAMGTLLLVHLPACPHAWGVLPSGPAFAEPTSPIPSRQPLGHLVPYMPRWELSINGTRESAIPLPGKQLRAGAGYQGERMAIRLMRRKPATELEQPSPSSVSSPSPALGPTAPHRLIGPVVLLKDVLHPVLTAVREHHDHLVAVGTRDVGLWGRETVPEARPGASGARHEVGCSWEWGWMRP